MSSDLAVHALAQLPESVSVEVASSEGEARRAMEIARAYGIDDRIDVHQSPGGTDCRARVRFTLDGVERPYSPNSFARLLHDVAGTTPTPTHRGDDRLLNGARIAVITNQPAHYRTPLFNGLAERLGAVNASLRVFFLERTPAARPWLEGHEPMNFDFRYLPSLTLPIRRHRRPSVPFTLRELGTFRPTIVLVAGLSPLVAGRARHFGRKLGAAVGAWSGDVILSSSGRSRLRQSARRKLLSQFDFAIVYGWKSREYIERLAPDLPVVIGRNAAQLPAPTSPRPRFAPVLIAVGDLSTARKGIDVLVDAMSLIPGVESSLRVIGGGRAYRALDQRAQGDERIAFIGSLQPAQTRAELSSADAYLFPSRIDVFGLSLLEAMGAGLVPVVTKQVGAVEDLCVPHVNCLLLSSHEPEEWARAIERLCTDVELRVSLGDHAAATVAARWTMDHSVDAMIAGLRLGAKAAR